MVSTGPSDVSAVVITVGEPTTQEVIDSVARQTLPPAETIVVRNVAPFHKALNAGVAQVRTPFFVQVDADMILDPHCFATLREGVRPHIGIVVGRLRDVLVEQLVGVKLFRTQCFEIATTPDSIAPDTDFVDAIALAGWKTEFIGRLGRAELDQWATFGEHRPAYTPAYTYRKHLIEGSRYRHRRTMGGMRWRLRRLQSSQHPSAMIAQIGLARGLFLTAERDLLGAGEIDDTFARLDAFLNASAAIGRDDITAALPPTDIGMRERFYLAYRLGSAVFAAGDPAALRRVMTAFDDKDDQGTEWVSKVAFCQGLLAERTDGAAIEADYDKLREFIDPNLDAVTTYAAQAGLKQIVVTGPAAAEYKAERSGSARTFRKTSRIVVASIDERSRPRIAVPFELFGNIACTEPERLFGIRWCLDLLKSGYTFAHLPTAKGPKRVSLAGQLARNIAERAGMGPIMPASLERSFRRLSRYRSPLYQPEAGRVLMIATTYILGGAERQMAEKAAGLARRGYDVRLIAMQPSAEDAPSVEDSLSKLGISTQLSADFPAPRGAGWIRPSSGSIAAADLSRLPPWIADRIQSLSLAIEFHRPAVVHTWLDAPAISGGLAACALGVPRVVVEQGSLSARHHVIQPVGDVLTPYRCITRNSNVRMVNNSAAGAADYADWLRLEAGKVRVIHNGFAQTSLRVPAPDELAQFRAGLGFPVDAPIVGALMRLVEDKDPDLWLATAAEIARARPDVRFLIAGYGPLHDAMLQRAAVLGIDDRLALPGPTSDLGLVYASLKLVLLTSLVEGVPNVLLEAQAAGCPIVATDVGGVREAVIDGRTARLVGQRSPHALAEAALAILGDASWHKRLRTEGPAFVAARFGHERMIDETLDVYGLPARAPASCEPPVLGSTEPRAST